MAFEIENFREVGDNANFVNGGQAYTLCSVTDTLATMMADSYLDDGSSTLKVGDSITLCGSDFSQRVRIASNSKIFNFADLPGVVTVTTEQIYAPAELLTISIAISLTTLVTDINTSGGVTFNSLADGTIGQVKIITHVAGGNNATLSPNSPLGYPDIILQNVGDTVTLLFKESGWAVISKGGLGAGPIVL